MLGNTLETPPVLNKKEQKEKELDELFEEDPLESNLAVQHSLADLERQKENNSKEKALEKFPQRN